MKPARQKEILTAMKGYKDYSVAFAQSLILKTPPPLRATRKGPGATALEQCVREVTVPPRALLTPRLRRTRPEHCRQPLRTLLVQARQSRGLFSLVCGRRLVASRSRSRTSVGKLLNRGSVLWWITVALRSAASSRRRRVLTERGTRR